jgi:hypothetical protein
MQNTQYGSFNTQFYGMMELSFYSPIADVIAQSMKCLSVTWRTGAKAPNARLFISMKIIAYRVMTPYVVTGVPYERVAAVYSVEA